MKLCCIRQHGAQYSVNKSLRGAACCMCTNTDNVVSWLYYPKGVFPVFSIADRERLCCEMNIFRN